MLPIIKNVLYKKLTVKVMQTLKKKMYFYMMLYIHMLIKYFGLWILKCLSPTSSHTVESTFGQVPFGSPLSYQQKLNSTITDIANHHDVRYPDFTYPSLQQSYNAVLPENQLIKIMGMNITDTTSYFFRSLAKWH